MKNVTTPLYDALLKHRKRGKGSFHVPGHKNGTVFYREAWKDFWPLLQLDVTELNGLDDLHAPEGPIAEAEKLASQLYGSRHTFFLVGGSTVGNLAMLLATLQADETVLVQRNVHQSIINGLKLRGRIRCICRRKSIGEADWRAAFTSIRYRKRFAAFLRRGRLY